MNIYKKLQIIRCDLQRFDLKKSGNNKFAGYQYFELGDFLPTINDLMLRENVTSAISFEADIATLVLIDCDKPEDRVTFTTPMASAQLKGCHDIQNLGAVQTYIRRYLYTTAFEIVEHDALDAVTGSSETVASTKDEDHITKLKQAIMKLAGGDKQKAVDLLEQYTSFTNKEGQLVKGRRNFDGMTEKQILATLSRVKKDLG